MSKDNTPKTTKPFKTTRLEVAKTVAIAILLTSIVAFVAGMHFEKNQQERVSEAVQAVQVEAPVKK